MTAEAIHAALGNRSPADLGYYLNLAIDYLDFAPAARTGSGRYEV